MIQSNRIETRSLLITAAIAVAVYVGCFVILEVLRLAYDKRRAALDDIDEKESEE